MVDKLTDRITSALEAGDFGAADPLLADFFAGLEASLSQTPDGSNRAAFLQDAIGWMCRWLSLSQVTRSHLNEQVRLNVRETSYGAAAYYSSTVEFSA